MLSTQLPLTRPHVVIAVDRYPSLHPSQTAEQTLAINNQIQPLSSLGIVAQITPDFIVYDAATTQGGSGGPVLSLSGQVVAVTSAVVSEFGGSNIGVPASQAIPLLQLSTFPRLKPPPVR